MADYRFEEVNSKLQELEGKYRDTLSGVDWVANVDPTYGSCYYGTITHNFGSMYNNVTCIDTATNEIIQPMAVREYNSNSILIFMPINTLTIEVVVN